MSQVITTQIQLWRQKVHNGTITQEEMKEAIAAIRKERVAASTTSAVSRAKKAPKVAPDSDAMLAELF